MAQSNTRIDPAKVKWDAIDPAQVQWDQAATQAAVPAEEPVSRDIPTGMRGGLEAAASLASGTYAGPMSGYAGIAGAVLPGPKGQGADWQRQAQEALTYAPRTDMGRRTTEAVSYPFVKLSELAERAGGAVTDVAGPVAGTATNVALNAIPLAVGGVLPRTVKPVPKTLTTKALQEAADSGYYITPTQADKGIIARSAEGLSGSAKMEKLASVKNQQVTNRLIREDLGLKTDEQISTRVLEAKRAELGEAYEAVKSSVKAIKPDAQFQRDLNSLRGDYTNAANAYPDLIKNDAVESLISALNVRASPRSMVELTRKLRKDATANLKSYDDPGKQALGFAQRNAATAVEELIDRALTSVGREGLVADFRRARQQIAKSYDVEAALNEATGDISARHLAKLYDKGKPLTGGLEKVAKFGQAFEGSARDVAKMRDITDFSYGDILMGGMGGLGTQIATGNPLGIAAMATRPLLRHLLLNKAKQPVPMTSLRDLGRTQRGMSLAEIAAGIQDQESR